MLFKQLLFFTFTLYFNLSASLNLKLFTESLESKISHDLVSAVNVVIEKVFLKQFSTVNVMRASENLEMHFIDDLINGILHENGDKSLIRLDSLRTITSIKSRLKRNNIILLEGMDAFRILIQKLTPNIFMINGLYLFVLVNGTIADQNEIFQALWNKSIYNVNVMNEYHDGISVTTFMPFKESSKCGDTNPVTIRKFKNKIFSDQVEDIYPEKFKNLHNCPIKIITFEDSTAVYKDTETDELRGFDIEFLKTLAQSLNFRKQIKFLQTSENFEPWGMMFSNGTVTGALKKLVNKNAEIGIGNYFLKPNRLEILDSSATYNTFPSVFIIPPGVELSAFKKLLQPFDEIIWILLLITILIGILVIIFIKVMKNQAEVFVFGSGIKYPLFNMLAIILGIAQPKVPGRNFARSLWMMFSIFCLVQRSIYQGKLFIFLQSDQSENEVQSFEEMIEKGFEFYIYEAYADVFENQPEIRDR